MFSQSRSWAPHEAITCACGMWMWASMKPGISRCGRWSVTWRVRRLREDVGGGADGGDEAVPDQDRPVLVVGVGRVVVDALRLAQEAQDAAAQDLVRHVVSSPRAVPARAHGRDDPAGH